MNGIDKTHHVTKQGEEKQYSEYSLLFEKQKEMIMG